MTDVFISILNMSITASYVIQAVILLRFFLKKLPKKYSYILWSVVGFRLCCPISFKSVFSLFSIKPFDMTQAQSKADNTLQFVQSGNTSSAENVSVGIPAANAVINDEISSTVTYTENIDKLLFAISLVWISVIALLLLFSLIKYIRLKNNLSDAIKVQNNIYKTDKIATPFIVGIIKPKIYIPSNISEEYTKYVIAHEEYHLKRLDNIIKFIAFILLIIHWYNPLCWLAFFLMSKDMEMSCDEAVLVKNEGIKKIYSTALLSFASGQNFPMPAPLSFSEGSVKERIKNILFFKKPKAVFSAIAIILCSVLLVACAANPKEAVTKENIENTLGEMLDENEYSAGDAIAQNMSISRIVFDGRQYSSIKVYGDKIAVYDSELEQYFTSESVKTIPVSYYSFKDETDEKGSYSYITVGDFQYSISNKNKYLFIDTSLEIKAYSNSKQVFHIYYVNGNPVAISDVLAIYRLESRQTETSYLPNHFSSFVLRGEYEDYNTYASSGTVKNQNGGIFQIKAEDNLSDIGSGGEKLYSVKYTYSNNINQTLLTVAAPDLSVWAYIDDSLFFQANECLYRIRVTYDENNAVENKKITLVLYAPYMPVGAEQNMLYLLEEEDSIIYFDTVTGKISETDMTKYIPKITEKQAIETAYSVLLADSRFKNPKERFDEPTVTLLNTNQINYADAKNPCYMVSYFDKTTTSDTYSYYIDAETGEMIYNRMMGD